MSAIAPRPAGSGGNSRWTASKAPGSAIAFVWCLIMFFMMPYWHVYGKQTSQRGLPHDARDVHRQDHRDGRQVQGA